MSLPFIYYRVISRPEEVWLGWSRETTVKNAEWTQLNWNRGYVSLTTSSRCNKWYSVCDWSHGTETERFRFVTGVRRIFDRDAFLISIILCWYGSTRSLGAIASSTTFWQAQDNQAYSMGMFLTIIPKRPYSGIQKCLLRMLRYVVRSFIPIVEKIFFHHHLSYKCAPSITFESGVR